MVKYVFFSTRNYELKSNKEEYITCQCILSYQCACFCYKLHICSCFRKSTAILNAMLVILVLITA